MSKLYRKQHIIYFLLIFKILVKVKLLILNSYLKYFSSLLLKPCFKYKACFVFVWFCFCPFFFFLLSSWHSCKFSFNFSGKLPDIWCFCQALICDFLSGQAFWISPPYSPALASQSNRNWLFHYTCTFLLTLALKKSFSCV